MGLFSLWPSRISEVSRSASLSVDGGRDETLPHKNAATVLCCSKNELSFFSESQKRFDQFVIDLHFPIF